MTVLPAGPKGSSFELIAKRPSTPGCCVCATGEQNSPWSGAGNAGAAGEGSVWRKVGYIFLSRRNMTCAADPRSISLTRWRTVVSDRKLRNGRLEPDAALRKDFSSPTTARIFGLAKDALILSTWRVIRTAAEGQRSKPIRFPGHGPGSISPAYFCLSALA
ncbi:hypothetical protein BQ8482_30010 [Mesorhizobium delmotii]|uniref:Uncharacterized protein n=1 Tax=Mesorhizobium delmotii TaxID=1631247 RepID=A0A2P9AN43_9HYPH|nr:hypothetical protein BQ8482_30010 [Mesorhizobium delmotii]